MKLLDERLPDGSRHFSRLPSTVDWKRVRDHVPLLPEAKIVNFIDSEMSSAWLDFSFRGHRFLIKIYDGLLHFFVDDPLCSDLILFQVGRHFEQLMENT
jgi:hypothetical protein